MVLVLIIYILHFIQKMVKNKYSHEEKQKAEENRHEEEIHKSDNQKDVLIKMTKTYNLTNIDQHIKEIEEEFFDHSIVENPKETIKTQQLEKERKIIDFIKAKKEKE